MRTFATKTAMRQAFESAKIDPVKSSRILHQAVKAAKHGSGEIRRREWDAHLKLSTFNALKLKGVMC